MQRTELLKQQCHTENVVSNIHKLGAKNTQKLQKNWKTIGRFAPTPVVLFFNFFAILCIFWAQPVYVADYFSLGCWLIYSVNSREVGWITISSMHQWFCVCQISWAPLLPRGELSAPRTPRENAFGPMTNDMSPFIDYSEDGIIEARVSHRKSSQQHTQAGPKKYKLCRWIETQLGTAFSGAPQGAENSTNMSYVRAFLSCFGNFFQFWWHFWSLSPGPGGNTIH